MATTVREIKPGDEDRVLQLTEEFLKLSPYTTWFPPKDGHLVDLYQRLLKHGAIFVAVNRDDYPIGLIAGAVVTHAMNGEPYGEGVVWYVDKGHRGGDTGRNLLGVFVDWCSTNGATVVKLSAPAGSPVGVLLQQMGFHALETHFVLPLQRPTAKGPIVLQGVTADDLQQDVRRQRQGGGSGEPQPTHGDGHGDGNGASSDDVDRTDAPA